MPSSKATTRIKLYKYKLAYDEGDLAVSFEAPEGISEHEEIRRFVAVLKSGLREFESRAVAAQPAKSRKV